MKNFILGYVAGIFTILIPIYVFFWILGGGVGH